VCNTTKKFLPIASKDYLARIILQKYTTETAKEHHLNSMYLHEGLLACFIARMPNRDQEIYMSILEDSTAFISEYYDEESLLELQKLLQKCHLWQPERNAIFTSACLRDLASAHFATPWFQCYSRLLSYNILVPFKLLNIYDTPSHIRNMILTPRDLNHIERKLFTIYEPPTDIQQKRISPSRRFNNSGPLIVSTLSKFKKNMNKYFFLDKWHPLINWEEFFLVGGSVLRAVLADPFDPMKENATQDIDLFWIGKEKDYYDYEHAYTKFVKEIKDQFGFWAVKTFTNDDAQRNNYIRRVEVSVNKNTKLIFQLIWYKDGLSKEEILSIFDLETCMIGYDGKNVHATYGWVQAQTTGTSVNYKLINSKNDLDLFLPRTVKYWMRGYDILTPNNFDITAMHSFFKLSGDDLNFKLQELKKLSKAVSSVESIIEDPENDIDFSYSGFLLNNDSMQVRDAFVNLITE
jgi:hypothetical protein